MLRICISATILLMVECTNLMKTSTNITVWLASRDKPVIILKNNQMIPSTIDCHHNGKTYKEGETWFTGHLLYNCSKFGAYTIIGCRTKNGRSMIIGEIYINDFIAHQCFEENSRVYYRESPCDLTGEPSCASFKQELISYLINLNCNKICDIKSKIPIVFDQINQTEIGYPSIAGLPQGWKIVDSNGQMIPLSRIKVISYPIFQRNTTRKTDKIFQHI
uniref:Abnormal cell migration protein 18-like fibronectin type I domain-containing protein n=1 Tax=Onchocerca volvulus TaxID=6282 RepID=A0A8R1TPL0_ONCVO